MTLTEKKQFQEEQKKQMQNSFESINIHFENSKRTELSKLNRHQIIELCNKNNINTMSGKRGIPTTYLVNCLVNELTLYKL